MLCRIQGSAARAQGGAPSPLTASYSAGRGSAKKGGAAASVGHLYAFGNTEEEYRTMILGCAARGAPSDGPFDHATGKGWVAQHDGHYKDALLKGDIVVPWIIENTGGIAPHPRAVLRRYARRARGKDATDRTAYGRSRVSTTSHYTHHAQRIVTSVQRCDAQNIREGAGHLVRKAMLLAPTVGAA